MLAPAPIMLDAKVLGTLGTEAHEGCDDVDSSRAGTGLAESHVCTVLETCTAMSSGVETHEHNGVEGHSISELGEQDRSSHSEATTSGEGQALQASSSTHCWSLQDQDDAELPRVRGRAVSAVQSSTQPARDRGTHSGVSTSGDQASQTASRLTGGVDAETAQSGSVGSVPRLASTDLRAGIGKGRDNRVRHGQHAHASNGAKAPGPDGSFGFSYFRNTTFSPLSSSNDRAALHQTLHDSSSSLAKQVGSALKFIGEIGGTMHRDAQSFAQDTLVRARDSLGYDGAHFPGLSK